MPITTANTLGLASRLVERLRRRIGAKQRRARLERGQRLEAAGKFGDATAIYLECGAHDQAARLYELRADAEPQVPVRARLLAQAAAAAGGEQRDRLARRRAQLLLDEAAAGRFRLGRSELMTLGEQLVSLGKPTSGAMAYRLAGDVEGEARALVEAGAVEELEATLDEARARAVREHRERQQRIQLVDDERCGRRRSVLGAAVSDHLSADAAVQALVAQVAQTRVTSSVVHLEVDSRPVVVAFGSRLILGRAGADISISAPGISRTHAELSLDAGAAVLRDLGSRNGTLLAGVRLAAPLAIREPVGVSLGDHVEIQLEPHATSGVWLRFGEQEIWAPLAPLRLGSFTLSRGADGWLEADAAAGAYLGDCRAASTIQLCRGDVLRMPEGEPRMLRVVQ